MSIIWLFVRLWQRVLPWQMGKTQVVPLELLAAHCVPADVLRTVHWGGLMPGGALVARQGPADKPQAHATHVTWLSEAVAAGCREEDDGLMAHFFGPAGDKKLDLSAFNAFLLNLHAEIVRLEFQHYDIHAKVGS